MERVLKQDRESTNPQRTAQAKPTSKPRENELASSPLMVAQRKKLHSLFGGAIQFQGAEEEALQGKFATTQRVEDEGSLQGKFATAQRAEEDEPPQGNFGTAQRVEEKEPLQGKFDALPSAQRKEEPAKSNNTEG